MTSNLHSLVEENKELLKQLMILEKFIELKSNECAYYRAKVHLMQISTLNPQIVKRSGIKQNHRRSSSEDISHNSTTGQHEPSGIRRNSVPLSVQKNFNISRHGNTFLPWDPSTKSKHLPFSSSLRRYRKTIHAQNQNHYEEKPILHDKNIQCNHNNFPSIEFSSKSSHTVLIIRLPDSFLKLLTEKQNKNLKIPKLKVHISSELLKKLFHFNSATTDKNHHQFDQFTIDSQYGKIAARIHCENSIDHDQSKIVHAKAEVKNHHDHRLPTVRHVIRTRSNGSDKKRIVVGKNLHAFTHKHRRKKKHLHKSTSNASSEESIDEAQSTIDTLASSSSDQTSNSIRT
ncbi:unnamed protein product [Rotaria socialis]|uniref:Uncharacterized protein n=2 Tax=Rotaria socialis TaxID=392032 RepID=A0A818HMX2_9BILA|nr:unnamed protein product [Rotaria socialis]CAF3319657.1 unnamed protein product [Rotaria socialis]CAF3510618.1 unnamed protein product [Rotaria socialis]CAF3616012.1 unnamed protein product [Rotaria socialis]CAF4314298.1 unnamed protein product [Rotaria socialis]